MFGEKELDSHIFSDKYALFKIILAGLESILRSFKSPFIMYYDLVLFSFLCYFFDILYFRFDYLLEYVYQITISTICMYTDVDKRLIFCFSIIQIL